MCIEDIDFHIFFVFRDLLSWMNSIHALVSSEDLARDVAEAEALQDRHQVKADDLPLLLFLVISAESLKLVLKVFIMYIALYLYIELYDAVIGNTIAIEKSVLYFVL